MILVDANIFMDVLTGRSGADPSSTLLYEIKAGKIKAGISALTVPILWYLQSDWKTADKSKQDTKSITEGFSIAPLTSEVLNLAYTTAKVFRIEHYTIGVRVLLWEFPILRPNLKRTVIWPDFINLIIICRLIVF